ncbi:branched-chain amino acid transport system ATP-binding protein [Rhizobium sp. ERR 922]|uniref:ABC transporter ATP-binding protein n=1 Tax=unclassified Rhizobium TaxID=2613769 RepID=UPI0011A22FFE|nr:MULTISPECIES: ABC transporter ATP-binding protein [unclassified Rhizobium]TWB53114.1 branched-chain amino acid transport system ATP-binding protein [Rhizobium sp. ERR 922]TWB95921.1 branched-chain amino acid transport system ATP-binding protein [Rhizobium sp. ERR 942]
MTTNALTPLLSVSSLSIFYGAAQALWDIDLEAYEGECISVIGANGAGKSSLISAIMGVQSHVKGSIRFQGEEISRRSSTEIAAKGISIVPERRRLFPSLTIEENIQVGAQVGRKGPWSLKTIYELFPELESLRAKGGHMVSGGQQQMAAFARALMANPRLILCDEISLGLAPIIVTRMYAAFPALIASGISMLIVEQETRRALNICNRFYCLLDGKVSLRGRPSDFTDAEIHQSYFGV